MTGPQEPDDDPALPVLPRQPGRRVRHEPEPRLGLPDQIDRERPLAPPVEPAEVRLGQGRAVGRARPLDPAGDPDRFRAEQAAPPAAPGRAVPLDPALDPDRFAPVAPATIPPSPASGRAKDAVAGRDLEQLLGKDATFEDERDGFEWLLGLLFVLAFLAFVAFLFNTVISN